MEKLYPWQTPLWQRWTGLRSRLPHAILLKGAQGIGKLDFALHVAHSLLCEKPLATGMPCGECASCRWFEQNSHPDFRLVQPDALAETEDAEEGSKKKPSRQISVDQIRALADFANLSAHRGGFRVVVIHPAEAMNANAANALLKTLEEPSPGMLMILVSHKPQQLLPTIVSRCLALAAPQPSAEQSTTWLKQQGVANPAIALAQASFSPLTAARLAEESAETGAYHHFLEQIRQPGRVDVFALAEQWQKAEPGQVVHWLQQWCYDLASAKLTGKVRYNPELSDSIKKLAEKLDSFELQRYQKELLVAKREALHPLNARLQLESLLLSYRQLMLAVS